MKLLRDTTQSDLSPMELPGHGCTADNNASRGAIPVKKGRKFLNKFCECGQPAVTRSANSMACQRCADLTSEGDTPMRGGRPERQPSHCGWVEFRQRCNAFFAAHGLSTEFQ